MPFQSIPLLSPSSVFFLVSSSPLSALCELFSVKQKSLQIFLLYLLYECSSFLAVSGVYFKEEF